MSEQQFFYHFRKWVNGFQTKKDAALFLDVSTQFVGDMFHGRRKIPESVISKMGFVRKVTIVSK